MTTIDITALFRNETPRDFSASPAEDGPDVGRDTWRRALHAAEHRYAGLADADDLRAYFTPFGAWTDKDLADMQEVELLALLIQFIAGDMRQLGLTPDATPADFERAYCDDTKSCPFWLDADTGRIIFDLSH